MPYTTLRHTDEYNIAKVSGLAPAVRRCEAFLLLVIRKSLMLYLFACARCSVLKWKNLGNFFFFWCAQRICTGWCLRDTRMVPRLALRSRNPPWTWHDFERAQGNRVTINTRRSWRVIKTSRTVPINSYKGCTNMHVHAMRLDIALWMLSVYRYFSLLLDLTTCT